MQIPNSAVNIAGHCSRLSELFNLMHIWIEKQFLELPTSWIKILHQCHSQPKNTLMSSGIVQIQVEAATRLALAVGGQRIDSAVLASGGDNTKVKELGNAAKNKIVGLITRHVSQLIRGLFQQQKDGFSKASEEVLEIARKLQDLMAKLARQKAAEICADVLPIVFRLANRFRETKSATIAQMFIAAETLIRRTMQNKISLPNLPKCAPRIWGFRKTVFHQDESGRVSEKFGKICEQQRKCISDIFYIFRPKKVYPGDRHVFICRQDGALLGFGANEVCQLGFHSEDKHTIHRPIDISQLTQIYSPKCVFASNQHSIIVTKSGTVIGCGNIPYFSENSGTFIAKAKGILEALGEHGIGAELIVSSPLMIVKDCWNCRVSTVIVGKKSTIYVCGRSVIAVGKKAKALSVMTGKTTIRLLQEHGLEHCKGINLHNARSAMHFSQDKKLQTAVWTRRNELKLMKKNKVLQTIALPKRASNVFMINGKIIT